MNKYEVVFGVGETIKSGHQAYEELMIVSKEEYNSLFNDSRLLYALIELGVEEWEGWHEAQRIVENEDSESAIER